ncbi:lipoate--protein ligase family protein [Tautonia sociabilis]|uniref:Lipoate--protein ligase family protein n=1 Tax=Tautonia sociabilis TaxID=2080755 RepID=A0A432MN77_9BACT|nr:lipoate--protein ligase family protein [Tautonia sociabilis]RUL88566.1 lipoate--protein ligase family protein [Tautonia sociabilis]
MPDPDLPPFLALGLTLPGVFANLALDEALLIEADREGSPAVLRWWELPELAVVMGASCRMGEDVAVDACRRDGVPIARRASGGGTVLIGPGALNVSMILPIASAPGLGAVDEAQRWVLGRIADRLRALGLPVEVLGSGDLTLGGRKFSGSAQRRLKRCFLVHASILYGLPVDRIARYLGAPPRRQPEYRAGRAHDEFVTLLPLSRDALLEAVRDAWLPPGCLPDAPPVPEGLVAELVASKYADPAWIERF